LLSFMEFLMDCGCDNEILGVVTNAHPK